MSDRTRTPIAATSIAPRARPSTYPPPFAERLKGRLKRPLGEAFGLRAFGVNLTTLPPGAQSALMHRHTHQEEFIFILQGRPTLRTDEGDFELAPGMCMGFAPAGLAHHLVNLTQDDVDYLEMGNRPPDDNGEYPADDLRALWREGAWLFTHKDGTAWE